MDVTNAGASSSAACPALLCRAPPALSPPLGAAVFGSDQPRALGGGNPAAITGKQDEMGVGDPASAGGLDWVTHRSPFQPRPSCDSVGEGSSSLPAPLAWPQPAKEEGGLQRK